MADRTLRHIAVEGPIGVGKTTLARRLARSLGSELLLEDADANPFLPRFYEDPKAAALPTQLFFLFQRARQVQALRQGDMFEPLRVSDFILEKDQLFAAQTLSEEELQLYRQVYRSLALDAPAPDLVIYLQAPVPVLMKRIAARGLPHELHIREGYLARLVEAYVEFFYHYAAAPLLIVNAAEVNFAEGARDYDLLLDHLRDLPPGRHYFNPASL